MNFIAEKWAWITKGIRPPRDGDGDGFVSGPDGKDNIPVGRIPGRVGSVNVDLWRKRAKARRKPGIKTPAPQSPRARTGFDEDTDLPSRIRFDRGAKPKSDLEMRLHDLRPLGIPGKDQDEPSGRPGDDPVARYGAEREVSRLIRFHEKFGRMSDDSWDKLKRAYGMFGHNGGEVWNEAKRLLDGHG